MSLSNTRSLVWVLVALGGPSVMAGCDWPSPPPQQDGDRIFCNCRCVDNCQAYELSESGIATGRCVPGGGPTNIPYNAEGDRCVPTGASGTDKDAACQLGCTELNTQYSLLVPFNGQLVNLPWNNPLATARICNAVAPPGAPPGSTVSRVSPNACELDVESTSEPLIVESGDKRDTQLTVATNLSSTVARIGSEVATFRPTEGQVEIEGGNCVGVECPISLTHVRLVAPPFTMAGRNVSNVILDNTTALKGIKDKYGRIRFDCNSTNFVAAGTVDGYRSTIEYQALPGQVSAAYDPISGKLSLSASVTSADGTQSLNVTTQSTATARPPRANAGADQTVNNGIAQLNGSASSDPDGGTLTYLWTEGTQVLGSTAVASVNLPVGVHDILLTVTDATGRQDYDIVRVTVASGNPNGCPAGSVVLMGTPNNDNLQGTAGNDCIFGLGGQDTISGGGGNDVLSGGDGDDIVNGGDGNDTVLGGTGQDVLTGGNGNDSMSGDDGDDRVSGDAGNDTLAGGQGQDQLSGGDNDDNLNGGDGDDRLDGGNGNDRLDGAVNRDTCIGGAGTNVFLNCETQQ